MGVGSPYDVQPLKAVYITGRLLSLGALLPVWTISSIVSRPRASWTVKEAVMTNMIRWLMPLNAQCGISPLVLDKTKEVPQHELKETSFVWLDPVPDEFITGIAKDDKVKAVRIPGYVWPKGKPLTEIAGDEELVMLWIHGGGYMMGNGSETFPENNIARLIQKQTQIKHILSLDYRVTGESCHPGQLLDALSAYYYLVNTVGIPSSRIVVAGACAGGHLSLMLVRYLYEEKVMHMPKAMMLFSPWVDMVIDKEIMKDSSKKRPNTSIDMLSASFLANLRFLGHHPESLLYTPAFSANRAPPGSYPGYPPTFLSVGDAEAFQRECTELADRMKADGVDITFDVQKDAVHDFLGMGSAVPSEKARKAVMVHATEWVSELVNNSG